MERNNIVPAPQIANVEALFTEWKKDHMGSKSDFYDFLTSPTQERESFLAEFVPDLTFTGTVLNAVINLP